jgi:hypothetical protein
MPFAVSVELQELAEDEFLRIAKAVTDAAFTLHDMEWQEDY